MTSTSVASSLAGFDVLVQEGFYSNRPALIRTASRNQLSDHADEMRRTVSGRTLVVDLQRLSRGGTRTGFQAPAAVRTALADRTS